MLKRLMFLVLAVIFCSSCSVYMAAKQPKEKNMDVLATGTPRALVLAEFGQPITTETRAGKKVDVFAFTQGYSKGAKTSRAVFHGLADVFTLGLWEAVGTPAEAVFDGKKVTYEVTYNEGDKVEKVVPLTEKSKEELPQEAPKAELSSNKEEKPVVGEKSKEELPQEAPKAVLDGKVVTK